MHNALLILAAFGLVLANAFFVAAEFAMVKLRTTQAEGLAETHGLRGRVLKSVRHHLDSYLSACQLGITLASLGLGWIGEPAFARVLRIPLGALGFTAPAVVHGVSIAVAFALITFLHIVLGELAPKSLAIRKTRPVSVWTSVPLWAFYWLTYPFIWLLNQSAFLILRMMGVRITDAGEEAHSVSELRRVLATSHVHGELDEQERDIMAHTLGFSELTVGELMRPASEMVWLDLSESPEENLARMDANRFSRYPVCDGDRDNVLGLAHVKDVYQLLRHGRPFGDLKQALRNIQLIDRGTSASELLALFRSNHPHFAVVDDELGQVVGFVTLDHVFEALVGDIPDEFAHRKVAWRLQRDGSWIGSGSMPLYTLERLLGRDIDEAEVDSVGGLVMWRLDRVPRAGDRAAFTDFDLVVREMRGPRIGRVQVYPHATGE